MCPIPGDTSSETFCALKPIKVTASLVFAEETNPQEIFFKHLSQFKINVEAGNQTEANEEFSKMLLSIEEHNLHCNSNVILSLLKIASNEELMVYLKTNEYLKTETIGNNGDNLEDITKQACNLRKVIAKMLKIIESSKLLPHIKDIKQAVIVLAATDHLHLFNTPGLIDLNKTFEPDPSELNLKVVKTTQPNSDLRRFVFDMIIKEIKEIGVPKSVVAPFAPDSQKKVTTPATMRIIYAALGAVLGGKPPINPIDAEFSLDSDSMKKQFQSVASKSFVGSGSGPATPNTGANFHAIKRIREDIMAGEGINVKTIFNEIKFYIKRMTEAQIEKRYAIDILDSIQSKIIELPHLTLSSLAASSNRGVVLGASSSASAASR